MEYFNFEEIFEFSQSLILTFAELEGRSLVHRDLKIDNILYNY